MSVGKNVWPMYRKTKLKQEPGKKKNRRYQHHDDSYGGDCPGWCSACRWENSNAKKIRTRNNLGS